MRCRLYTIYPQDGHPSRNNDDNITFLVRFRQLRPGNWPAMRKRIVSGLDHSCRSVAYYRPWSWVIYYIFLMDPNALACPVLFCRMMHVV